MEHQPPPQTATASPPAGLEWEVSGLYQAHVSELLRFATTHLGDRDGARDAVQEVFLRYFVERRYGRQIENPRAWLYHVLRNYVLDRLNAAASKGKVSSETLDYLPSQDQDPEKILRRREMTREIAAALTTRESQCLRLRVEGLSYAEIAGALGVRLGTVGALLTRVHRKILLAAG